MVLNREKRYEFGDLGRCGPVVHGVIDIWQHRGIVGRVDLGRDWYHNGGKTSMRHIPRSEWWAYVKWRIGKLFRTKRYMS